MNAKGKIPTLLLIFLFCVISCDEYNTKTKGVAYINRDAGIRFLTSDSKKQTQIDGFIVEKDCLYMNEWNLEYSLSNKDFCWGSEETSFGRYKLWSKSKTDYQGVNYDEITGGTFSRLKTHLFHFHFFDVDFNVSQEPPNSNFDEQWHNNGYEWPNKINIIVNANDCEFEKITFFQGDLEMRNNWKLSIVFLFENINQNVNEFINYYEEETTNHDIEIVFHLRTPRIFHGNGWNKFYDRWTGSEYCIVANDYLIPVFKGIQITNYSNEIWKKDK